MAAASKVIVTVPVGRLFLYLQNPRHDPLPSEAKAIEYLCSKENVLALARDIAKHGLNPLELLALLPTSRRKTEKTPQSYNAVEGNRRVCAIKLLNDPDLAPASLRKSFENLAQDWTPVTSVQGIVFNDFESARLWLDRIHNGPQDGVGRKQWTADQKARFDGENKNRAAQQLLDYAQSEGMITAAERERKLTTVQRFVGNRVFSENIGIDQADPDEIRRTRPKAEFDVLVRRFMRDLVDGTEVNSRRNSQAIVEYFRPLGLLPGVTGTRIEAEVLTGTRTMAASRKTRHQPPAKPAKIAHVEHQREIEVALKNLGNGKLQSLYYSICAIDLDPHCPIIAVGTWSFFETLTSCVGRNANTSFDNFLSRGKLGTWGFQGDTASYRSALERIREYGNSTKHHSVSAAFNGDQLNNDITALKPIILKCIEEAAKIAVKGAP